MILKVLQNASIGLFLLWQKKKQTNLVLDFPASGRHILEKLDTIEKEALTCANIQHESP